MEEKPIAEAVREFKEAFDLFDKDRDGIMPIGEFGTLMRSLGQNPTDAALQSLIDELGDDDDEEDARRRECGCFSFAAFLNVMLRRLQQPSEEDETWLRELFVSFDVGRKGFVTAGEVRRGIRNIGERLTDAEVEEIIPADVPDADTFDFEQFRRRLCPP